MKSLICFLFLITVHLRGYSQAYLAYTKEHVDLADSHFVATKGIPKGEALYILPHKTHHGLHLHNGYYWAVHVRSHQEGFVPSHSIKVEEEIPFNMEGTTSSAQNSDIQNPVVEIKNSSKHTMRIKVGEEEHEVEPHQTKTLHLKRGRYYYRVSMPEIDHYYAVEQLEEYKLYTWDFYVHEEPLHLIK